MPETNERATSRFAVNLDQPTDARFERLTSAVGQHVGRVRSHRGRRYPSRADLLRAMLVVVEQREDVRDLVFDQVKTELTGTEGATL